MRFFNYLIMIFIHESLVESMKNIVADTGCISPPCLFTFYLLFASSVVWEAFKYNFWNDYLPPLSLINPKIKIVRLSPHIFILMGYGLVTLRLLNDSNNIEWEKTIGSITSNFSLILTPDSCYDS